MNEAKRQAAIDRIVDLFDVANDLQFTQEATIATALGLGLVIANELHAISTALEWQVEDVIQGRNRA